MKNLLIIAGLVFAVGCGKKGGIDGKLDELSGIKDKMCECKDKACADKVHEDYISWKKSNGKDEKPNKDQMEKFEQIKAGMNLCRSKAEGTAGGADPAAPAGSAAPAAPAPAAPAPEAPKTP